MDHPDGTGAETSHLDLLVLARAVREALIGEDTEDMHIALAHLRKALASHLHDEHGGTPLEPGVIDALVENGQKRLLALLDEVLHTVDTDVTNCNCLVRGAEIEIALGRQARLETRIRNRSRRVVQSPPGRDEATPR